MKSIATIIAMIIVFTGYIPYFRDSLSGKTKPHVVSWFTWALVSFLAFGVQLLGGGGAGSLINFFIGLICASLFIIGLKNGTKNVTQSDIIALILALVAIAFWLIVKEPLLSIILVAFIDLMSFYPTFRKSWGKPWSETLVTWEMNFVKNAISIYALESLTLVTALYPTYSLISTGTFCLLLIIRRRSIPQIGF